MFGTLIESRPQSQRRRGSAMLSAVVHTAIVACAIVATRQPAEGVAYPDPARRPDTVVYVAPPTTVQPQAHRSGSTTTGFPEPPFPRPPITVDLHGLGQVAIDPTIAGPPIVFGGRGSAIAGSYLTTDGGALRGDSGVFAPERVERTVAVVAAPRPAYPEMLRTAGVEGRVVVRFVVDTSGRVEPASLVVLEATHALFERAVRDALPRYRFAPARIGDRAVRQLVEMPFQFSLSNR